MSSPISDKARIKGQVYGVLRLKGRRAQRSGIRIWGNPGIRKLLEMGEEERFEFVQLPRDVRSELQAQAKDTAELFQKWYDAAQYI